ncbi:MAG: FKBP-type peptidyl-prolyl cis-trans isomerase [Candidatus Marinimicrobia bacterium]|nr:FKBP-type peptidyl-prolyl cis-trans isomerase [Candidatus Neomarinimicrobiota bacterium]MDP6230509.1 FKBP-type peptidyl-prolyl cis-trans isomerase [Candidatus Neomarinimicrobiota bacterium]MDP7095013.1 FKBP-type peptidyl-prolyl cis-trans isomerase [Candidatus Neomarinimicrobiota bacterium]MDP7331296.1 FKBP-type peptidyl-prolyl cis-trans isomerase [Candidatus Neomarinimicrobiota bacterium]
MHISTIRVLILVGCLVIMPGCQNERTIMENGLIIETLVEGDGAVAEQHSIVTVNYTGTLINGTVFDSSLNPGREPFRFTLGVNQVISGWDQGVLGMKIGEKRKLTIPPELGYGSQDMGVIPPNSTLIFEVELLEVE